MLTCKSRRLLKRNKRYHRFDCIAVWIVGFFCTKYVIRYSPGDHYIHLYWSSVPLDKSPILAYCPGPVLPVNHAHVVVTGEGRDTARATVPAEFIVDGKKAGPGKQFTWHKYPCCSAYLSRDREARLTFHKQTHKYGGRDMWDIHVVMWGVLARTLSVRRLVMWPGDALTLDKRIKPYRCGMYIHIYGYMTCFRDQFCPLPIYFVLESRQESTQANRILHFVMPFRSTRDEMVF